MSRKSSTSKAAPSGGKAAQPSPSPKQQTTEQQTEAQRWTIPWDQVRREGTRLGKRWRRQMLPLVAIGGTHAVGAAAAGATGAVTLAALALGWAAAAAAYGYAARRSTRWLRAYAAVAAMSSVVWETLAAVAGADGITAAVLWVAGPAVALPWWVRHAEPEPDITAERAASPNAPAALPPAKKPRHQPEQPDPRAATWGRHLGANNKPLHGSKVTEFEDFAHGWKATVQLPIGEHWHKIMGARNAILSVFDLPDGRAFVEAIPGASVRIARLTVLTSDPLQTITRWTGPSLNPAAGTVPLMVTADGDTLPFRFWWPGDGAAHALVSGANGSGKTKVLDLILTEAGCSDRIVPLVVDGGGGASLPQWTNRVPLAAETPGDARKLLRYVLRVMERRRTTIKRQRGGSLEPTPRTPLICVVIDEAHRLLMNDEVTGVDNRDFRRMCEILTQEGRKFGISLVLATQVPSAKQLGGSTVLRDQLKAGTVVGLRVSERSSTNMISPGTPMPEGLHQLPAEFPDGSPTRGLGYVLTARMVRARSLLIDNPETQPMTDVVLDADSAAEPTPNLTGDTDTSAPEAPTTTPTPPVTTTVDEDATAVVQDALADGTHADPLSLMQATGLSLRQVRNALAHHKGDSQ